MNNKKIDKTYSFSNPDLLLLNMVFKESILFRNKLKLFSLEMLQNHLDREKKLANLITYRSIS